MSKDKIQPKVSAETPTEQQKMQSFATDYQALCEKHQYRVVTSPAFQARDDGTWSVVLQVSVGKLPKPVNSG